MGIFGLGQLRRSVDNRSGHLGTVAVKVEHLKRNETRKKIVIFYLPHTVYVCTLDRPQFSTIFFVNNWKLSKALFLARSQTGAD